MCQAWFKEATKLEHKIETSNNEPPRNPGKIETNRCSDELFVLSSYFIVATLSQAFCQWTVNSELTQLICFIGWLLLVFRYSIFLNYQDIVPQGWRQFFMFFTSKWWRCAFFLNERSENEGIFFHYHSSVKYVCDLSQTLIFS